MLIKICGQILMTKKYPSGKKVPVKVAPNLLFFSWKDIVWMQIRKIFFLPSITRKPIVKLEENFLLLFAHFFFSCSFWKTHYTIYLLVTSVKLVGLLPRFFNWDCKKAPRQITFFKVEFKTMNSKQNPHFKRTALKKGLISGWLGESEMFLACQHLDDWLKVSNWQGFKSRTVLVSYPTKFVSCPLLRRQKTPRSLFST